MNDKNKHRSSAVIVLALLLIGCASAFYAQGPSSVKLPSEPEALHAEILKYKTWTVVNPDPVKLDPIVAALCADLRSTRETPHKDKFIRVYVNAVGQDAMLTAKKPKFPLGTIVVKEKLREQQSPTPEFFTIMLKREAGYDPRNGDWQYLIMAGDKAKVETPGDMERCQSCHSAWAEKSDFVSRNYLSLQQNQQLR